MKHLKHCIISTIVLVGLVCPVKVFAGYGDWKIFAAYSHAAKAVTHNNKVYVLSDNGLYSYNPKDTRVETYDKASHLSDNQVIDIALCEKTKLLVILYENGNVDLMDAREDVYNMPELKEKTLNDRTIKGMTVDGENIYISTYSGIVVLDTKRKVFSNYYNFGQKVNSVLVDEGYITAITQGGVFRGKTTDNLLDNKNWEKVSGNVMTSVVKFHDKYYITDYRSFIKVVTNKEKFYYEDLENAVPYSHSIINGTLYFWCADRVVAIDAEGQKTVIHSEGIHGAAVCDNKFWLACDTKGLIGATLSDEGFKEVVSSIKPNSPIRNNFYNMRMVNGRLLSVGGMFEFSGVARTATVTKYENGQWTNFEEDATKEGMGGDYYYRNFCDIIQDPDDPEHHFVAANAGLIEYKNYKFVKHYTYNNSPLMTILPTSQHAPYYTWTSGLEYDRMKNLWMLNSQNDTIIRIMKPDGKWIGYYCPEIAKHPIMGQIHFDERGWVWINSRASGSSNNAGLFVLNTNGTLNQRSDDKSKFVYIFNNQDGTNYQVNNLNCFVEDLNGAIWIGTNFGPFVTYEPTTIFNEDFYFTQCKVPRNDGTNYADYLLNEIEVRCMAVDGGNRKWIGTLGNGVYLVNEDGSEILEHFTTDNSPLISNDIYSIVIDGSSGEVFIATANGLVSYMGNATDPEEEFSNDIVKVYPNPVRPEYNGNIIITGLKYDSDVKIVNAAGRLVRQGKSVGGEFTWNGLTDNGKRAASGIYYVFATDEEGNKGAATKFLIVR